MTQTTCAACWKTTDDKHILCTSCETQLQFDLQWFENHLQDLEWRTNRMDKTGNGGGGGHNGLATSPAPLRETAFELIESDYVAKDEDDAWDYAGEICGYREDFIDRAKEVLEVERHAVTE